MPQSVARVTRAVLRRPALRPVLAAGAHARSVAVILRSGLFDGDFYTLQAGRSFASVTAAVRDYVATGRRAGRSPHPLFEPAWAEPATWRTRTVDPFAHHLLSPGRRVKVDPHPLFHAATWVAEHPAALGHRGGALGHFIATAGPGTPLPGSGVAWGTAWAALVAAAAGAAARERLSGPRQFPDFDDAAERAFRASANVGDPAAGVDGPVVSVVMPAWNRAPVLRRAVASVQAQTLARWELVVVDDGSVDDTLDVLAGLAAFDPRIRVVRVPHGGVSRARNAGIAAARAPWTAFLDTDNTWRPDFLATMVAGLRTRGLAAGYAAMRLEHGSRVSYRSYAGGLDALLVGNHVDLNVLVVDTVLLREAGGFAEDLRRTVDYDLVLSLAERTTVGYLPFVGADYTAASADTDRISLAEPLSWDAVVRLRHLLPAGGADAAPPVPGRTALLVPVGSPVRGGRDAGVLGPLLWQFLRVAVDAGSTGPDPAAGAGVDGGDPEPGPETGPLDETGPEQPRAGRDRVGRDLEVLVTDGSGSRAVAAVLASAALLDPRVAVAPASGAVGTPMGVDLALARATGDICVVVDPRYGVEPGWLDALTAPLADPDTAATGSLLLGGDGTVASAGGVTTPGVDLPVDLLAGQPAGDVTGVGPLVVTGPRSAALAARTADLRAVGGLDPLFGAVHADVDLGLRLVVHRAGGRVLTVPAAVTTTPGPAVLGTPDPVQRRFDDRTFADRWAGLLPDTAAPAWAATGTRLAHVESVPGPGGARLLRASAVRPPRTVPAGPGAGLPSLRWAIQTGAPAGQRRRLWGDWHFAGSLAASLRRLGQDAVVLPRDLAVGPAGPMDDVVLTIRGLTARPPDPATTDLLWVISHPELVGIAELRAAGHVFAASIPWAHRMSERAGRPVLPLLQCTDPGLFHPPGWLADGEPAPVWGEGVLFVGNSRKVVRPVVEAAAAVRPDLAVWGGGWGGLIPDGMRRGTFLANDELAGHYAAAGVVLNDHWDDMRVAGFLSNRLFDAVASGARVVSDRVEGVGAVFGDSVRVFDTAEGLHALLGTPVQAAFPDAAARVAAAGRVAAEHSFDARARELLAVVLADRGIAVPGHPTAVTR